MKSYTISSVMKCNIFTIVMPYILLYLETAYSLQEAVSMFLGLVFKLSFGHFDEYRQSNIYSW